MEKFIISVAYIGIIVLFMVLIWRQFGDRIKVFTEPMDNLLKEIVIKLWRSKFVKIPVLAFTLLVSIYLSFIPMLQVIYHLYESKFHMGLLVILVGSGCFGAVWSIREIYRVFKPKKILTK